MKVLYKGVSPEEKPFHLCCDRCQTLLELKKADLENPRDSRDESFVNCPVCRNPLYDNPMNISKGESAKNELEAKQRKMDEDRKQAREDARAEEERIRYEQSDGSVYGRPYDSGERSGGPTGPLPPPELPHYVKTVKAFAGVKD